MLLKIHSRCNLACDYCYVYQNVDQSWRNQPVTMAEPVVELAAARIAEHAARHHLPAVTVIFHGGEPLLARKTLIGYAAQVLRSAAPAGTRVDLRLQTNGVLLDDDFLDLFDRHDIRVGVSLDAGETGNDRHRIFPSGRGSYRSVARALRLLAGPDRRHLYGGVLSTIDLLNDPIEVYRSLLEFDPPRLDFLLPHGNWTAAPPGRPPNDGTTPYADWLIPIFDRWYATRPQRTGIRLFEALIDLLLGGASRSEAVGLGPVDLLTIETDGTIEHGDTLKTTEDGMAATGLHLRSAGFDDVLALPEFRARQSGLAGLAATCRACPLVRVCGGGLYAHRYRADNGFDNPSVYCPDLAALIRHVHTRLSADLRPSRPEPAGARPPA
ncbi:FxsB family radical SAM/SPASM domain protein [Solwaraspora sp. WMMD1047]|uniref:FxsB family cyclophane-forming radical SAM/SPASM peptide maturase n=1 Tax=Solwaraspora sp. WMMD1047 TaxID=3016102 RepID=UPI002415F3C4|nr:FxsB family cyclophane-forming radical SAM/SPASM peptide maturase [Solwaraspora sp. WMMD1047]MDG4833525.1 FxsB family radical SAM/SPASM domain protein [Solwaraspora sp. WMMD1047]